MQKFRRAKKSRRRPPVADGTTFIADEAYLCETVIDPAAKVVPGFESPMPSYAGILNARQLELLVLYVKSLC